MKRILQLLPPIAAILFFAPLFAEMENANGEQVVLLHGIAHFSSHMEALVLRGKFPKIAQD